MCKYLIFTFLSLVHFSLASYEVVIATIFNNEARYLKEWIEYHRMIGVDHFWLYNDWSTDNWREVLEPYVAEGLVEVFERHAPIKQGPGVYFPMQASSMRDALKRGLGKAKWVACIDIDEFIIPLSGSSLPECLDKHFKDAGAVYANWRCFGTGGVTIPEDQPILFSLVASSLKSHPRNCVGKSIYRPEAVMIDYLWYAHACCLKEGMNYLDGDGKETLITEGTVVKTDGKSHTKYIRINHYVMRDEDYFQNVRLERARKGYQGYFNGDIELLIAQNKEFSLVQDHTIINFIKKNYPEKIELWEQSKDFGENND